MDRNEAMEQGLVFLTLEMTDFLQKQTSAPEQVIEIILGSWVGVLRSHALSLGEASIMLLKDFQHGEGCLRIGWDLIPLGQVTNDFLARMRESSIDDPSALLVIKVMKDKLFELDGLKAFQPIGWFVPNSNGFLVRCWSDFLQPLSDDPIELIQG